MFKKNIQTANSVFTKRHELSEKLRVIDEEILELPSDVAMPLGIILDSIDRVGDYGTNISETAINSAISSDTSK
jgi:hypothetical protein